MFEKYNENKKELCDCVKLWIKVAEEIGKNKLTEDLKTQLSELRKLRFNIAVLGNTKRGKSTLINTLLGRQDDALAPTDSQVCTGGIVHYMDLSCLPEEEKERTHERAYVYLKGSDRPHKIALGEIGQYIREENNPKNTKGIDHVEVFGNFSQLKDCCLVDTPGADAVIELHGELAHSFLPHADAIIMTILAGEALTDADQSMLKAMSEETQRRVFYVVTRIDDEREEDRQGILDHVKQKITQSDLQCSQVYPVAYKKVFDAMRDGKEQAEIYKMRQEWGVATLEQDLEEFIKSESRPGRKIGQQLMESWRQLNKALEERDKNVKKDVSKLEEKRDEEEEKFRNLRDDINKKIVNFEGEWNDHTQSCLNKLGGKISSMEDRLRENIDSVKFRTALFSGIPVQSIVKSITRNSIQEVLMEAFHGYADITDKYKFMEIPEKLIIDKEKNFDTGNTEKVARIVKILVCVVPLFCVAYFLYAFIASEKGLFRRVWDAIWGQSESSPWSALIVAIIVVGVVVFVAKIEVQRVKFRALENGKLEIERIINDAESNFSKKVEDKKKKIVSQARKPIDAAERELQSKRLKWDERRKSLLSQIEVNTIENIKKFHDTKKIIENIQSIE